MEVLNSLRSNLSLHSENNLYQSDITLLRAIVEAMPTPVFFKDTDMRYQVVNQAFAEFNGVSAPDVIGKTVHECWHKGSAEIFYDKDRDLLANPGIQVYETQMTNARGQVRNVMFHKATVHGPNGQCQGIIGVILDMTERKRAELALHAESRRNAMMLRMASDGVHVVDANGNLAQMSDSFCRVLGYTREEMQGMHVSQWDTQWTREELMQEIARLLAMGEDSVTFETLHRCKDGKLLNVEVSSIAITLDGAPVLYCSARNITERKQAEELIHRQANYDQLTQLPNRRLFHDRLQQEIRKAERNSLPLALLLIDLDRFKEVNDTLGHHVGDELLVEAARRITCSVRKSDTVARLGGDEFTVILPELEDASHVERIAENIVHELAAPFLVGGERVYVSASLGITLFPDDANGIDTLLKNADQAMYQAKNKGRNGFCYYTAELQWAAQKRMRLVNDLHSALEEQQFRVYYQPIIELATGSIHKVEALVRWRHPIRGLIYPAEFIPLAEENGLINDIGNWVFRQAVEHAKRWRESYGSVFQISVNKSPVQFRKDDNAESDWLNALRQANLPGDAVVVEITEGLLLHAEHDVTEKLLSFRDAGVHVAIDDFGTGYSSLSYLKKFDIDYLKIDQTFVQNLDSGTEDSVLCEAIIMMAHKLGLKVIAEGVETRKQRDLLLQAGCDYAQGFLFARPVPAEEFEQLLAGVKLS